MFELNLSRTGVPWLFGHNHQNSSGSSTLRNREWSRGHFHLWVTLFKRCCSHSGAFSFYPASLFHGEVLITLNSLTVVLWSAQSAASVCTQAIKTSARKELEGTQSGLFCAGEEKESKKKVKRSLKECFCCSQRGGLAPCRGKCSSSETQQQDTTGFFSPPAHTLTPFIWCIEISYTPR